jgi:nucleoside-diphosphate-sugar epimerase
MRAFLIDLQNRFRVPSQIAGVFSVGGWHEYGHITVLGLVEKIIGKMKSGRKPEILNQASNEVRRQYLSAERARSRLKWAPEFTLDEGLERTIAWYRKFFDSQQVRMAANS